MKNEKGFTLIELLAVIVILAVIALIATPVVMNSIEEARKGSAKNAGFGVLKAIEHDISLRILSESSTQIAEDAYNYDYVSTPTDSNTFSIGTENDDIDVQGTRPNAVELTIDANEITGGHMCVNNYPLEVNSDGVVSNMATDNVNICSTDDYTP